MTGFLDEIRFYKRDDRGHIVKVADHLMDDMRYLNNSGRYVAEQKPVEEFADPYREPSSRGRNAWLAG